MATDARQAYYGFSYDVAERIAPTWASRSEQIEGVATPVREWLLRELRASPGETVLELAAGTGETGFEAAAIVGPRGRLISSDFSPAMLETARRRGAQVGVGNVEYRVIDAERIDLDTDSVDRVLCRYGYMLMADPARALAESRRVLRPGGRLTLAVWGPPERNAFFTAIVMSLVQRGHMPPPEPEGPGLFSMASEARTRRLLDDAGFADVRTGHVPMVFPVPDVDAYVDFVADTAGPVALVVRGLSSDERREVSADVEAAFERMADGSGYRIPGLTLCAAAS